MELKQWLKKAVPGLKTEAGRDSQLQATLSFGHPVKHSLELQLNSDGHEFVVTVKTDERSLLTGKLRARANAREKVVSFAKLTDEGWYFDVYQAVFKGMVARDVADINLEFVE